MSPVVFLVDWAAVPALWPRVEGYLSDALKYNRDRFTLEDIRDGLMSERMRLWIISQDEDLVCAFVSVITSFPAQRVCTILLCGGRDADSWVGSGLGSIEEYARGEGCGQVEIIGRPGWRRKCAAYDHAGEWLVKELS